MKGNYTDIVYQCPARYDFWIKAVIFGVLAVTLLLGLWQLFEDTEAAVALLGVTVFDGLLFHAILPRRIQVLSDRIRIVLGRPFSFSMPFATISEAVPISAKRAMFNMSIQFATSLSAAVEIRRKTAMNVTFSPENRDTFLEELGRAMRETGISAPG